MLAFVRCLTPPVLLMLMVLSPAAHLPVQSSEADKVYLPTHKQIQSLKPQHNDAPITLNTFCLDSEGNILACVGGDTTEYVPAEDGSVETRISKAPKLLQKYSPEGKLLKEVELDFKPTAINQAANGTIFVAGTGKVARLTADCEVLVVASSPHIGDLDAMKAKAETAAREQIQAMTGQITEQIKRLEQRIATLREKPVEELSDRDKRRLETLEEQKTIYSDQQKETEEMFSSFFSADSMLERALEITSLAVTSKDVFLCCGALEGHGYEVWRTDHDLSSPKKVVTDLGGCCGQCDIQATEDHLILAENTKFQVGLLDRDGNRLTSFGQQDRTSKDGFGSCCNPMNVRCCSNGDILTAESSLGFIKRFNKDGALVSTVGKAKIGGGCKHVAIGFDEKRDRYYMQYQDRNQICVLVPLAEAPEVTAEEKAALEAQQGLARKLTGDSITLSGEWSLTGKRPAVNSSNQGGLFSLLSQALGANTESVDGEEVITNMEQVTFFAFHSDGSLNLRGGYFEDGENSWEAISQDESNNTVTFAQLQDGIQYYDYRVKFIDDHTAEFSMLYGDDVMNTQTYHRIPLETKTKPEASTPQSAATGDNQ